MREHWTIVRGIVGEGNESPKVDLKARIDFTDKRAVAVLARLCLAMANTDSEEHENFGYIVIGAERRRFVGGADAFLQDSFCASVPAMLNAFIAPPARLEARGFQSEAGVVGVIIVRPSDVTARPHLAKKAFEKDGGRLLPKDSVWVRRGESVEPASREDLDRIYASAQRERTERERESWQARFNQQEQMLKAVTDNVQSLMGKLEHSSGFKEMPADRQREFREAARAATAAARGPQKASESADNNRSDRPEFTKTGIWPIDLISLFGANIRREFGRSADRSAQSEAKVLLTALKTGFVARRAEVDAFPASFEEARFEPAAGGRYLLFLSPTTFTGALGKPDREQFAERARTELARLGLVPFTSPDRYLVAAVGEYGDRLDVWKLDEGGEITHVQDAVAPDRKPPA